MGKTLFRIVPLLAAFFALAPPAPAANEAQIKAAINGAIGYLKSQAWAVGNVGNGRENFEEGPMALAGIALIEAGVETGDPVIQNIAKIVREQAIRQLKTYQLSLDIIFLDKLGEQIDTTLIQSMGVRLLGGQSMLGGWTYECPMPDEKEQNRLRTALGGASMKGTKGEQIGLDPSKRPALDASLNPTVRNRRRGLGGDQLGDDNSNTQFALLGLWAARRHGVPVDEALHLIDQRMPALQTPVGGWGYTTGGVQMATAPMTCSGLLGLAIAGGSKSERSMKAAVIGADGKITSGGKEKKAPNMLADPAVQRGLAYLGAAINGNAPVGGMPGMPGMPIGPGAGPPGMPGAGAGGLTGDLYFMWSLERVCVVYGLATIGNKDWHNWGADAILKTQQANGSWTSGRHGAGPNVDTSFGLMFLCKSNIVRDLSTILKSSAGGPVKPSTTKAPSGTDPTVKGPPDKPADTSDAAAMAKALATATGAKYAELLKEYTDAKGPAYTDALAKAIPQLTGDVQKRAREALAERMARFSGTTIKERLKDPDPELRRASALAVYMRDERTLIPDLIESLNDGDDIVVRGARLALRSISEKDFGPPPGATADQKQKAIIDWKAWWAKEKK